MYEDKDNYYRISGIDRRRKHEAAEEKQIRIQRQAARGALSDTAYLALENDGIPCMDLGTPDRYSHSPLELIDVKDLKQTGDLLCHFIDLLDKDFDLNRY